MLYAGTASTPASTHPADLRLEPVDGHRQVVTQWFSQPVVSFIGAHTGCSCGFPSVLAETPVEYYEGMPFESDDRAADLRSVRALLELLRQGTAGSHVVELYPVADGEEGVRPRGVVEWQLESLDSERFFFTEGFMHRVRAGAAGDVNGRRVRR
jgi:hypothetical protein